VQGDLLDPIPDFNEDIVRAFVATQSAQVRMAEADIAKQQYVQRRAEVDPYPDIRCGPSFQNGVVENTSQGWFTVAFFVPMWDRNQGNIRQARADVRASRANREAVQNDLLTIANDLLGDHYAARERAHRYHKVILPSALGSWWKTAT
jgi:outer membrane protein TolC